MTPTLLKVRMAKNEAGGVVASLTNLRNLLINGFMIDNGLKNADAVLENEYFRSTKIPVVVLDMAYTTFMKMTYKERLETCKNKVEMPINMIPIINASTYNVAIMVYDYGANTADSLNELRIETENIMLIRFGDPIVTIDGVREPILADLEGIIYNLRDPFTERTHKTTFQFRTQSAVDPKDTAYSYNLTVSGETLSGIGLNGTLDAIFYRPYAKGFPYIGFDTVNCTKNENEKVPDDTPESEEEKKEMPEGALYTIMKDGSILTDEEKNNFCFNLLHKFCILTLNPDEIYSVTDNSDLKEVRLFYDYDVAKKEFTLSTTSMSLTFKFNSNELMEGTIAKAIDGGFITKIPVNEKSDIEVGKDGIPRIVLQVAHPTNMPRTTAIFTTRGSISFEEKDLRNEEAGSAKKPIEIRIAFNENDIVEDNGTRYLKLKLQKPLSYMDRFSIFINEESKVVFLHELGL